MECENNYNQDKHQDEPVKSILSDLNDHCLLKIFGYLDVFNMANIRSTCKKLKRVSDMAVKRFKDFRITEQHVSDITEWGPESLTALKVRGVISYIAPVVESLDVSRCSMNDEFMETLKNFDLPKLKTLWIYYFHQLEWIRNTNVEELTVSCLRRDQRNNFSRPMTKLKQLRFYRIDLDFPMHELVNLFENSPKIDQLCLMDKVSEIPEDFFAKLSKLNRLEISLGIYYRQLDYALQIKRLTELVLRIDQMDPVSTQKCVRVVKNFLAELAPRDALRSLDLRKMHFDNELFDILESLNVSSMRLINPRGSTFGTDLAKTPFPALKYLDIFHPIEIDNLFTFVAKSTALEKFNISMLRTFDKDAILKKLQRLVFKRYDRPNLELNIVVPLTCIKVNESD